MRETEKMWFLEETKSAIYTNFQATHSCKETQVCFCLMFSFALCKNDGRSMIYFRREQRKHKKKNCKYAVNVLILHY